MKVNVKYIPCLFDEESWIRFESYNQNVLAILASLFQRYPEVREDPPYINVRVNGKKLYPLLWGNPLNDGDEILIIQEVGGYTIAAIGVWLGVWGATATTIGGLSIAATINMAAFVIGVAYTIYSYCAAPSAPSTGKGLNSSPTYGWDGTQMEVRAGVPVPVVYGEHQIPGNITGGKWS